MKTENMAERHFETLERVEYLEDALEREKGRAARAANSICACAEILLLFSGALLALTVRMMWERELAKAFLSAIGAGISFFASRLVRDPSLTENGVQAAESA